MPTRAWLASYADPSARSLVPGVVPDWETALSPFAPAALEQTAAFGDRETVFRSALHGPKSGFAPGALDRAERSEVLDALGIGSQLVFSTFIMPRLCSGVVSGRAAAAMCRAHNRAITDFCSQDRRLVAVGVVTFHEPEAALRELEEASSEGIGAVQVPTDAFWNHGPGHHELERFWAACASNRIAVVAHIGGGQLLPAIYHATGMGDSSGRPDGDTLRPKDFAITHHTVERFLTCVVLDGVLERHSGLRVGVIEQGASWLVGFMRHLDHAARYFRSDPAVARLALKPSEYLHRQVRVTPHYFEDVGWLVSQVGEDMLMFSTDYPHYEGGTDPVGAFESSFAGAGTGSGVRRRFYVDNYRDLIVR